MAFDEGGFESAFGGAASGAAAGSMLGPWGSVAGAAIGGLSSFFGGRESNKETAARQAAQNAFNAEQAQKQMDFQERMSSSAYQRSMADMRAAGLNPILAYSKGGASSPGGAAASGTHHAATDVLTPAVSSAMQAFRLDNEVKNMVEQNKNLQATNANLKSENIRIGASTANIAADTKIKNELFEGAMRESTKAKTDQEFYSSPAGRIMRMIGTGASEIGRVFGGGGAPASRITVHPGSHNY